MKQFLLALATTPTVARSYRSLLAKHASIFMLHRFYDPEYGVQGHSPFLLRRALAQLRELGLQFVPVAELFRRAEAGNPVGGLVAFTVDDGGGDFHRVGGPMFQAMECPVTVFLPTGYLDRPGWFWWDRLEYVLERAPRGSLDGLLAGHPGTKAQEGAPSGLFSKAEITTRLKGMRSAEQAGLLAEIESRSGVEVPETPPKGLAPMTWDEVRWNAERGVTFGPHTVSHPNMARLTPEEAKREVADSWDRVRSETAGAVPIFCYPYGGVAELLEGDGPILRECGMVGALTTLQGYVSTESVRRHPFRLPRFPWQQDLPSIRKTGSGLQRLQDRLLSHVRSRGPGPGAG